MNGGLHISLRGSALLLDKLLRLHARGGKNALLICPKREMIFIMGMIRITDPAPGQFITKDGLRQLYLCCIKLPELKHELRQMILCEQS